MGEGQARATTHTQQQQQSSSSSSSNSSSRTAARGDVFEEERKAKQQGTKAGGSGFGCLAACCFPFLSFRSPTRQSINPLGKILRVMRTQLLALAFGQLDRLDRLNQLRRKGNRDMKFKKKANRLLSQPSQQNMRRLKKKKGWASFLFLRFRFPAIPAAHLESFGLPACLRVPPPPSSTPHFALESSYPATRTHIPTTCCTCCACCCCCRCCCLLLIRTATIPTRGSGRLALLGRRGARRLAPARLVPPAGGRRPGARR